MLLLTLTLLLASLSATSALPSSAYSDCTGRRVHVLELPKEYTELKDEDWWLWTNTGFGDYTMKEVTPKTFTDEMTYFDQLKLNDAQKAGALKFKDQVSKMKWEMKPSQLYWTWDVVADVIFHFRMKEYPCRTPRHEDADAVYVPQFVREPNMHVFAGNFSGPNGKGLAKFLISHPAWKRADGKNFFTVLNGWMYVYLWAGNELMEGLGNMVKVSLENIWEKERTLGVPYPTIIHPRDSQDVRNWQDFILSLPQPRPFLFSVYASNGVRTNNGRNVRRIMNWQCQTSPKCVHVPLVRAEDGFHHGGVKFGGLGRFTLFMLSSFCLMPRGDSCTRHGLQEAMLVGCIPVVFERCSLEDQWFRFLPPEKRALPFFVRIPFERLEKPPDLEEVPSCIDKWHKVTWPEEQANPNETYWCFPEFSDIIRPDLRMEKLLETIPEEDIAAMRRNAVELIPYITYGGIPVEGGEEAKDMKWKKGKTSPPDYEDAFDLSLRAVLQVVKGEHLERVQGGLVWKDGKFPRVRQQDQGTPATAPGSDSGSRADLRGTGTGDGAGGAPAAASSLAQVGNPLGRVDEFQRELTSNTTGEGKS